MYRSTLGAAVSHFNINSDHKDEEVSSVFDLQKGDHIVLSGWMLHPRCHAIVVETNEYTDQIKVIRFTYANGVVEEWLPFKQPVYKVLSHNVGRLYTVNSDLFDPDEVISRARSKIDDSNLVYHIALNNCKTFVRWCKTGMKPADVSGYD
ncbi:hypothetical protein HOLleu_31209 [Holothuria leucospilota]|uniref:LRAT domain-containing protein n=1 Tax=Holothuria leucospilota TaxID=206669 RepID=A0A9Q1BH70_HOLLE|nr:hypothetical protein HOLleu_31209 [Holothuria leucospilota]